MTHVRIPTPAFQPLRSQHVDVLLDKASSLLTHSLDLPETLARLGDLLVPQFADWCNVIMVEDQLDAARLALTRNADPRLNHLIPRIESAFGEWRTTPDFERHVLEGREAWVAPAVSSELMREQGWDSGISEIADVLRLRSTIYLPLELDGRLLGALFLAVIDPGRVAYREEDLPVATRLATFAAAAIRNARFLTTLQDELAERRRMERQVRTSTATIRTLAAGLAHDIGNLLQPLRLRLDSLAGQHLPRMAVDDLKAIAGVSQYFQRLTSGLRLLAGDPRAGLSSGDITVLTAWWNDVEALMKDALPHGVELRCELADDLPPTRIPPAALTHIIFNLIQNAGQGDRKRNQSFVRLRIERVPGRRLLRFGVSDNGPGMDDEARMRCFDPFHSAVTGGASSRLGLPLVRTLVERAGGQISVESSLGEGATFVFTLPIAERRLRKRAPVAARVAKVTLVDSEAGKSAAEQLRASGFEVQLGNAPVRKAQVWVTDMSAVKSVHELTEFVVRGSNRRIVLVGAPAGIATHPRIHLLPSMVDAGRIRDILALFDAADVADPAVETRSPVA